MDRVADEQPLQAEISVERKGPAFFFRGVAGFEWTKIRLPVPGLAQALQGFRFVHLSDIHARGYWPTGYDELVEQLERTKPDLLLITGDFVNDKDDHRAAMPILKRLLPRLHARLGVYGILGNHDVDLVSPVMNEWGVTLLDGRRAVLEASGAKIELIGLPGLARRDLDAHWVARMPPKEPATLRIVLSHYPDHFRRVQPLAADIFLAGHTHGGQICWPSGKALITHDTMPKSLCKGVHRMGGAWYVVSRGLGYASLPVRMWCPPEVAEVTTVGIGAV
jgi:predicted MPP superfamily phosphohydrolase